VTTSLSSVSRRLVYGSAASRMVEAMAGKVAAAAVRAGRSVASVMRDVDLDDDAVRVHALQIAGVPQ
jgi:hypothetical protein